MFSDSYKQQFVRASQALDQKTKPPSSLGELEQLAAQLSAIQQTLEPVISTGRTLIFAGDHGVIEEGVSAYPQEVTHQMLLNFASGGAAVNALCKANHMELEVINTGVIGEAVPGVLHEKIADGTANIAVSAAMNEAHLQSALDIGRRAVIRASSDNIPLLAVGEMGIGNTTAAAAIVSALTGAPAERTTGRGTGLDDAGVMHKRQIVNRALTLHSDREPFAVLRCLGGFEIAAMTGAMLEAHEHRICVIVDGYIATAAALAAVASKPSSRENLVFSHQSVEPGHRIALEHLQARPLLQLALRLGEGSGATLAVPLLRSAVAILREMATFENAGVDREL
ncbi:nicotinate-nucleotide--dimethylbenzimidazole phosphoribosyltransferase [Chromatiales bacterium (ex Bugula neritina AB1)]|nr:nicotinate-nucleotide--dimethylbenzimidazole phosphoribosyltransferase [Chromatiales bacterium (ex Bugula neritina AB1)]